MEAHQDAQGTEAHAPWEGWWILTHAAYRKGGFGESAAAIFNTHEKGIKMTALGCTAIAKAVNNNITMPKP